VSIRTVSRALKNQPGVKPEVGRNVLELARHLGYTPNVAARNLRMNRSNIVGIIVSQNYKNSVSGRKVNDLQKRLEEQGFYPLFGLLPSDSVELRQMLQEWSGLTNTVVFLSWHHQFDPAIAFPGLPQQFIFVDIPEISGFHSLSINRACGIREAIRHFVDSGRRSIARCGNISSRELGFAQSFYDCAEKKVTHFYFEIDTDFESGINVAPQLFAKNVDAVFFDTDRMAYGFLKYCWKHGIKVPEQIAVIGFDDDPWCEYSCPSLSTVAHPIAAVNKKIVELAVAPSNPQKIEFPTRFIKRESV